MGTSHDGVVGDDVVKWFGDALILTLKHESTNITYRKSLFADIGRGRVERKKSAKAVEELVRAAERILSLFDNFIVCASLNNAHEHQTRMYISDV
jgi:hypothetical protein